MSLQNWFAVFLAAVGGLFCSAALAQTATYDFTGYKTGYSGRYGFSPVSPTPITGTLTISIQNANQITGTIGSTTAWKAESLIGISAPVIFSQSVYEAGQLLYSSAVSATFNNGSTISYQPPSSYLTLSEWVTTSSSCGWFRCSSTQEYSDLTISPDLGSLAFLSNGLLNVGAFSSGVGSFGFSSYQSFSPTDFSRTHYSITSISQVVAVPEPETYAMMLAGLGLLGVAARRRKQKAVA
jgi:hypothetical protein